MDVIDVKILNILQENSRVSISELSKQVSLSLSAVSERLKKLEASDTISAYTVILNPKYLGKDLSVMINISLDSPTQTEAFLQLVNDEEEILECHYITGEYDYMLKVTTKNTQTLEEIMNRIKSFPGIKRTQTNVILSTTKQKYSLPPKANKK